MVWALRRVQPQGAEWLTLLIGLRGRGKVLCPMFEG